MEERVVLVDREDREIGTAEKMAAHREGKLHRAISVFIFNKEGQMLLQQRAFSKYHSGGLWTNACCSHPRPLETPLEAARRRLQEEMGMSCELVKVCDFIYEAKLDKGMTEHEFDHVFVGRFEGEPVLNPVEAAAWKWIGIDDLKDAIQKNPNAYTIWFKIILSRVLAELPRPAELCP